MKFPKCSPSTISTREVLIGGMHFVHLCVAKERMKANGGGQYSGG